MYQNASAFKPVISSTHNAISNNTSSLNGLAVKLIPKGKPSLKPIGCVNDGKPNELAKDIIDFCESYTEYSPSGTGIRIIFKTNTDTEVLIHGYEEYGVDLFPKLRGMFAFVIYDIKNNTKSNYDMCISFLSIDDGDKKYYITGDTLYNEEIFKDIPNDIFLLCVYFPLFSIVAEPIVIKSYIF